MESSCHNKYGVLIPVFIHLLIAGNALGLPCRDQVVNIGETMSEVASKCGEAAFKEQRSVTAEETIGKEAVTVTSATIDEWTYNFGTDEPAQTYHFQDEKLVKISSNGYGIVRDFSIDTCGNGKSLAIGDSTFEAYLKCGEPIAKEKRRSKVIEDDYGVMKRRTTVSVVEWTYRYGPDAPGYTVTFENGVAAMIRTREFGK